MTRALIALLIGPLWTDCVVQKAARWLQLIAGRWLLHLVYDIYYGIVSEKIEHSLWKFVDDEQKRIEDCKREAVLPRAIEDAIRRKRIEKEEIRFLTPMFFCSAEVIFCAVCSHGDQVEFCRGCEYE